MNIGIHGKEFSKHSLPFVLDIFSILKANKANVVVSSKFHKNLRNSAFRNFKLDVYEPGESLEKLDVMLSIGGDGTMLDSVTHIGKTEVPILGINTGRLGFLATISMAETEMSISELFDKKFKLDKRDLLQLETDRDLFGGLNFGLNDFTVVKKDTSSMITVHTFIDGEFLNSYWADGIIVSTPTGSTGYSLSCGGPLVFPKSGNFAITPVSPHNLTVRPIVVSDTSSISFQVEGRSKKFLVSLDSRIATVDSSVTLKIVKAKFKVNLIQLKGQHYFKTLRQKLNWGLDIRN